MQWRAKPKAEIISWSAVRRNGNGERCDDKLAKWWKSTCGSTFMLDVSMTISIADDILLVVLAFRVVDR